MAGILTDTDGVECCCGPVPAQSIDDLRKLLEDGTITQDEFDSALASALTP